MSREIVNAICRTFPGAAVSAPWCGGHDAWKVGGKMLACIGAVTPGVSVKTDSVETAQMLIDTGVGVKAPYFHRVVAQSSVAKYMVKRRGPPSQGWRTFLHNHAPDIAAMDLFVVPTIGFELLYAFVIVRLGRRDLVWINVTAYPTADWVARQLTEAFPWNEAPR
jgi:hypothetical protein